MRAGEAGKSGQRGATHAGSEWRAAAVSCVQEERQEGWTLAAPSRRDLEAKGRRGRQTSSRAFGNSSPG